MFERAEHQQRREQLSVHTSVTELMWQYANSCFCREHRSWWRWAGWLLSEEDMPCCSLSLFFSSSPNAWSYTTQTHTPITHSNYGFTDNAGIRGSFKVNSLIYTSRWSRYNCNIANGNWVQELCVFIAENVQQDTICSWPSTYGCLWKLQKSYQMDAVLKAAIDPA